MRVIDPRASAAECVAGEADSHGGIKDSKVVWVGQNSDRILTTGFSTVTVKCASVVQGTRTGWGCLSVA